MALLVTAILHCNNIRDVEEDRRQGKRTLAALVGMERSRLAYGGMLAGSYIALAGLVLSGAVDPLALMALVTLPWAAVLALRLWRAAERPALHETMVSTSKLHLVTGLLLAGGLALHAYLER